MSAKSGQKNEALGARAKEAWGAKAIMEKYGISTIEELERLLAASGGTQVPEAAPEPPPSEEPPTKAKDDLDWITQDTGAVHVVARYTNLVLRPAKPSFVPPLESVSVFENYRGAWDACPFDLSSRNREQEILNHVHYGRWAHIAIPRDVAEQAYSDTRWPLPSRAVVSAKEFGGWDTYAQTARGTYRELTERVALRESVRRCLQRFVGQVFINARFHREIDPRIVNPYGNRLAGLAMRLPRVETEGAVL